MAIRKSNATANKAKANEPKFNTIEACGVVAERNNGWTLELRYGSWNGNEERYDLRPWKVDEDTGEEKCLKGIGLSGEELESLYYILKGMVEETPKKGKGKAS